MSACPHHPPSRTTSFGRIRCPHRGKSQQISMFGFRPQLTMFVILNLPSNKNLDRTEYRRPIRCLVDLASGASVSACGCRQRSCLRTQTIAFPRVAVVQPYTLYRGLQKPWVANTVRADQHPAVAHQRSPNKAFEIYNSFRSAPFLKLNLIVGFILIQLRNRLT